MKRQVISLIASLVLMTSNTIIVFGKGVNGNTNSTQTPKQDPSSVDIEKRGSSENKPWHRPLDLTPLNLTPEQKDKIQGMRKESSEKARELRKSLHTKRLELKDLFFDPKATADQIKEKAKEINGLVEQVSLTMVNDFLSIRDVLSPAQLKHLPELKDQFKRSRAQNFKEGGVPSLKDKAAL